jgi:hypothetical protein
MGPVNIKFSVNNNITENNKISINCFLKHISLVSRAPIGEEFNFDDDDIQA